MATRHTGCRARLEVGWARRLEITQARPIFARKARTLESWRVGPLQWSGHPPTAEAGVEPAASRGDPPFLPLPASGPGTVDRDPQAFRETDTRMASSGDRITQLLDEFRHSRDVMIEELSKAVIGQREVLELILAAIFTRGHVPAGRRAGPGQDADGQLDGPDPRRRLQADPVHARPDALGHHRHQRAGGARDRPPRLPVRPGADLLEHHPGRRDQPDPAQDPGRALAGDAGTRGHRRPGDAAAARAVLRHRHPEPDRAGGHLPAARGPARPLHVRHPGRLPEPGGGGEDPRGDDQGGDDRAEEGPLRPGRS